MERPSSSEGREALLKKWGAQCGECPFSKNGKPNNPVLGEGPRGAQAQGLLIGEGPGAEESIQGKPFVGPTGEELNRALTKNALVRARFFVVNATCCAPPLQGKSEAMMGKAVKACLPAFEAQIQGMRRKPAFVMGKWAWKAYAGKLPKGGVDDGRGFIRQAPSGAPYIVSWHPTYACFRNPFEMGVFYVDLDKFARLLEGRLRPRPVTIKINAQAKDILKLLKEGKPIASDAETGASHPERPWTGKNPLECKLKTVGLANSTWGLSVYWPTSSTETKNAIKKVHASRGIITHNGPWFDHRVYLRHRIPIGEGWIDTRDKRRALCSSSPLDLGYIAKLYDDPTPWYEVPEEERRATWQTRDLDELMYYNAIDCVETARADEGMNLEPEWLSDRVQRLYEIHKATSVIAAEMHTEGFPISQAKRAYLSKKLGAEYERRVGVLNDLVGIDGFKPSAQNMRALIYSRHENEKVRRFSLPDPVNPKMWTPTGMIKVDQGALLLLITGMECPEELKKIIDAFWQAESVRQAKSTYVDSEKVDHAIGADGRMRPGWNSCGTGTGRFSCSDPNIMNLSEEKE